MSGIFSRFSGKADREKLYNAMADYGVRYSDELEEDVRTLSDRDLMEKYGKLNVVVVAEITGKPYRETLKRMEKVSRKYNIGFDTYADEKLYLYEDEDELAKKIGRIRNADDGQLSLITEETGWTRKKVIQKVAEFSSRRKCRYRRYATYRIFDKTEEEIQNLYDRWKKTAEKNRRTVQKESGWPRYKVRVHMRRVAVQFDMIPAYYVLYRAWELTDEQLATYATQEMSRKIMFRYTVPSKRKFVSDKALFDETYKDYINRKFWSNEKGSSYESFLEFIDGVDQIFCKPFRSGGGLGTEKLDVDHSNPRPLYDYLMSRGRLLVEECVKQHHLISEFAPLSVNTIRVVVIKDGEEYKVLCTGIRFGYDGITDNFSGNGLAADVDPETGIIITDAVDKKGRTYECHPVSGKVFRGFQIPLWDKVISTAVNAMTVVEGLDYMGWDIALCEDRAVIIEANPMPDLVLVQAPYAAAKEGKKYIFEKYL